MADPFLVHLPDPTLIGGPPDLLQPNFREQLPSRRSPRLARRTATPDEQLVHVADLLAEVRAEYRFVLSSFEAIVDGVELAAEQVQDKRLELLERPPDVSLGEVLLTAFLVFGLYAGTPARFTTKTINAVYDNIVAA